MSLGKGAGKFVEGSDRMAPPRSTFDPERNNSHAQLASIANPDERRAAMRKAMADMGLKQVRATMAETVAHFDHIVKIAGIEYVGVGGDYDGVGCVPEGLDDVSKMPNLTRALLEKGYTAADIRKIYGGNLLRVMRAVEQAAGK